MVLFLLLSVGLGTFTPQGREQIDALKRTILREWIPNASEPTRDDAKTTLIYAGLPKRDSYPHQLTVLKNTAYIVGYDETRKNPAWVAYRIPAAKLPGEFPRPSRFTTDERTRARVKHDDFTGSGYDRGHMAPNHAIASRFGEAAQTETFLMSNVVPQLPALNQGPWRLMEEVLADHTAPANEEIWVVVGPIYAKGSSSYLRDGPAVPSAFYALVADDTPDGPRLQAFIIPQRTDRRADFRDFMTSVDDVQRRTSLDFFWELPDELEFILEHSRGPYWLEN